MARTGPPLWQWLAVGLGGSLVAVMVGRLGVTRFDDKAVASLPPSETPARREAREQQEQQERELAREEQAKFPRPTRSPLPVQAGLLGDLDRPPVTTPGSSVKPAPAKPGPRSKLSFPTEGGALDATRAELDKKDATRALAILEQFDKDYPQPMYAPDARALRIEAHALHQDDGRAAKLAEEFLQDFPHSPKADRVRAIREILRTRQADIK